MDRLDDLVLFPTRWSSEVASGGANQTRVPFLIEVNLQNCFFKKNILTNEVGV
jgi:hypothetical protein